LLQKFSVRRLRKLRNAFMTCWVSCNTRELCFISILNNPGQHDAKEEPSAICHRRFGDILWHPVLYQSLHCNCWFVQCCFEPFYPFKYSIKILSIKSGTQTLSDDRKFRLVLYESSIFEKPSVIELERKDERKDYLQPLKEVEMKHFQQCNNLAFLN
jgi:hypothetical protein